jgi:hypothetical protein
MQPAPHHSRPIYRRQTGHVLVSGPRAPLASARSSTLAFWSVLATQRRARGASCTTFHSVLADGHEQLTLIVAQAIATATLMRWATTLIASLAASVPLTAGVGPRRWECSGVSHLTASNQPPKQPSCRMEIHAPKPPLCASAVNPTGLLSCVGTAMRASSVSYTQWPLPTGRRGLQPRPALSSGGLSIQARACHQRS